MSAGAGWQDYTPPSQSSDGWQDFQPKAKSATTNRSAASPIPPPAIAKPRVDMKSVGLLTGRPSVFQDEDLNAPLPGVSEGRGLREGLAEWDDQSFGNVGRGVRDVARGNIARGGHEVISGGMNAMTPVTPLLVPAAPAAFLRGAAGGAAGGYLARKGAEALDLTPDQQDLAGDIGGIAGGYAGAKGPSIVRSAGPRTQAVGKVAGRWALGRIPIVKEVTGSPSLMDLVRAFKTSPEAPPSILDATGENKPFAGGADEYTPPPFRDPGAKLPQNPGARFLRENQGVYPGAPEPTATPEQLNPALVSPSRSLPGQISPEIIRPPAQPIPARPGLALPPGPEDVPAAQSTSPRLIDQIRESAAAPDAPASAGPVTRAQSLLDQIRAQARQIQSQVSSDAPPETPIGGRPLRIAGQEVDPNTDLTSALKRSIPQDKYPVKISYDEGGNMVDLDGRHRVLEAVESGKKTIPVQVRLRDGSVSTAHVDPRIVAKKFGVTRESLAATDAQQPYRKGNLKPRAPVTQ